jgi:hypothetical protein
MIVGIDNIYLYTGLSPSGDDCYAAYEWLKANDIPFTNLNYADPAQHESVFSALSTWFPDGPVIADFPFVTYEEKSDDYTRVVRCLYGLEAITTSNLSELVALNAG